MRARRLYLNAQPCCAMESEDLGPKVDDEGEGHLAKA